MRKISCVLMCALLSLAPFSVSAETPPCDGRSVQRFSIEELMRVATKYDGLTEEIVSGEGPRLTNLRECTGDKYAVAVGFGNRIYGTGFLTPQEMLEFVHALVQYADTHQQNHSHGTKPAAEARLERLRKAGRITTEQLADLKRRIRIRLDNDWRNSLSLAAGRRVFILIDGVEVEGAKFSIARPEEGVDPRIRYEVFQFPQ